MQRLLMWIKCFEDALLVAVLAIMLLLAASQVALRNVWESGISWGDPLLRVLLLWLAMLGAMAATRDRNHISIDALSGLFRPALQRVRRMVIDAFSAFVCALLAWQGVRLVLLDYETGTVAFAAMPAWIGEAIIPIGFGVMSLRFMLQAVAALLNKEAS